jgi:hypothetical protein
MKDSTGASKELDVPQIIDSVVGQALLNVSRIWLITNEIFIESKVSCPQSCHFERSGATIAFRADLTEGWGGFL